MTDQDSGEMPVGEEMPQEAAQAEQPAEAPQSVEQLQAELERIRKALRAANKEAAERRKLLEQYESEKKQREEAELSELDRLRKRLSEEQAEREKALAELQAIRLRSAIVSEAANIGFIDPHDAYTMIDLAEIEIDDNGQVTNAKDLLEGLAKRKPYLLKKTVPALNATNPGQASAGETDDQRRARLYGSGHNIFAPELARQHGGGVVFPEPKK